MLAHQQIPLLAKSALSCWMYPIDRITLSPTPSHPWAPTEGSRVTILLASSVRMLVHFRPPDLKSSTKLSLPFAWNTGSATEPSLKNSLPYARHYKLRLVFLFTQFSLWLQLILQTIYVLKMELLHFLSSKSAAYKLEQLQIKSSL